MIAKAFLLLALLVLGFLAAVGAAAVILIIFAVMDEWGVARKNKDSNKQSQ